MPSCFKIFTMFLALMSASQLVEASGPPRDRPTIEVSGGTRQLLSDKQTLLRGVSLSWDGGDPYGTQSKVIPTFDQLQGVSKDFGLNAIHLYLEGNASQNPNSVGVNLADADTLVALTRDAGLYLILTIGCNGENGSIYSMDFARDFWSLYASRYKDETHVIFEAHNEPALYTPNQWSIQDWDRQIDLYHHIRDQAPESLILLCSFMGFSGSPLFGIEYLEANGVVWDNCAIAHHGYESKSGIEDAISLVQSDLNNPALLCTEFWPGDTEGQGYNSMYESHLNGWMQFQWLGAQDADLDLFRAKMTQAGTIWTPDAPEAMWPAQGAPDFPNEDEEFGLYQRNAERFVRISPTNFSELTVDLPLYTGGASNDGFFIERLDGPYCRLRLPGNAYFEVQDESTSLSVGTADPQQAAVFEWIQRPNGDVVLRSVAQSGHLVRWQPGTDRLYADGDDGSDPASHFVVVRTPGVVPDPVIGFPYRGVPAQLPGRWEAEDFDLGGAGISFADQDFSNNGGAYRPLEAVDIEATSDQGGGFNIGWIEANEWTSYTIENPYENEITGVIRVRVATNQGGATMGLTFDGNDPLGNIVLPFTGGYQNWVTVSRPLTVSPGVQVMRFENRGTSEFNLNWFDFSCDTFDCQKKPECPCLTIGDLDCDGQVGFSDALFVLNDWGSCSGCDTDLNGDSAVEFNDMLLLLSNWGICSE